MVDPGDLASGELRGREAPLREEPARVLDEPLAGHFHNFESRHVRAAEGVDDDVDLDVGAAVTAERRGGHVAEGRRFHDRGRRHAIDGQIRLHRRAAARLRAVALLEGLCHPDTGLGLDARPGRAMRASAGDGGNCQKGDGSHLIGGRGKRNVSARWRRRAVYAAPSARADRLLLYFRRRAKVTEDAMLALGCACHAYLPTVLDEQVREQRPLRPREKLHEILLDLDRIRLARERQTLAKARDVGVDHHPFIASERIPEDDICRLAAHTGQPDQLLHLRRYRATMSLRNHGRHPDEASRLGPEEARALYHLLELFELRSGERRGGCITSEQRRRDHIDALVSALGAQDGRDEELEWSLE